MKFSLIPAAELNDADAEAWRAILRSRPDLEGPFLSPEWVRLLADCGGPDAHQAQVVRIETEGEASGFFAARVGRFSARAVGAPFCDYQAAVLRPGLALDARQLVQALGAPRLDLSNLVLSDPCLSPYARGSDETLVIDLRQGFDAYAAERKAHGGDVLADCGKKRRKLERDHGQVRFTAQSDCREDFETLLDWKRSQYHATGQTDVLAPPWAMTLMRRLASPTNRDFSGALFTLHVGETLIAAHFALRLADRLHAWIIAHNSDFARYSPGLLLLRDILQWAPGAGFAELDLGPSDTGFKARFANLRRAVGHGFVGRPSAATLLRAAAYGVRETAEALPLGRYSELPAKAMRRYDRIRSLV